MTPGGLGWAWLPVSLRALRGDRFFHVLLLVLVGLSLLAPSGIARYPGLVDWPTIAALTGLPALTKAVELSGGLHRLGHWLLTRLDSQRSTALCLVLAAALLSMLLTNDVALFVVVPLTLGVCRVARMPSTRLVMFEALAVNAGSTLTPIGNPQNLFLWQQSGMSFGAFVLQMLPLVALLMAGLLALTWWAFPPRPIALHDTAAPPPLDRVLLTVALALYLPFLALTDLHHPAWALGGVVLILLLLRRRVLVELDWGLLLVFVLMFIDLRVLAGLDAVRGAIADLGLDRAQPLYWTGIAASQLVSNVPAAIALVEYSRDWRVIAYAVNIGGFGLMIGSLANLIALRMADDPHAWRSFHIWSLPFGLVAAAAGWWLLFG